MSRGPTSSEPNVQRDQLDRVRRGLEAAAQEDVLIEYDRRLMIRSTDTDEQFAVRVTGDGFLYAVSEDGTERRLAVAFEQKSFTVAKLPAADATSRPILVTDEAGGSVLAFADGAHWRRVTDRAIVS